MEPKGGVGKSTVTALLGLSLRDMAKKVGLLDVGLSGSSLYKAMGLQSPPRLGTSVVRRKLIPPQVMGMCLFSICAHFGEGNGPKTPRLCWPICHHLPPARFFPSLTTYLVY